MPYLDFAAEDDSFGGYIELGATFFRAAVVGMGRHPLIALHDDDVRPRGGDVRAEGLWASITCEQPGEHWSAGMEAFAVGYDDPRDAQGDEWGDRVALGFDLEWEREGELWRVTGDVLIDDERVELDVFGNVSLDAGGSAERLEKQRLGRRVDDAGDR